MPELAETLRGIATAGSAHIYRGDFADKLAAHVQRYGGWLDREDLAGHCSDWVAPLAFDYHGCRLHECPPNGQGLAALLALALAKPFQLAELDEADRVHVRLNACAWASRRAALRYRSGFRRGVPGAHADRGVACSAARPHPHGTGRTGRAARPATGRYRHRLPLCCRRTRQRLQLHQQPVPGNRHRPGGPGHRCQPSEPGGRFRPGPGPSQRTLRRTPSVSHDHPRHGDGRLGVVGLHGSDGGYMAAGHFQIWSACRRRPARNEP